MPFPTPILDRALADLRHQNEQQRLATSGKIEKRRYSPDS
jgi:hypothetical protein